MKNLAERRSDLKGSLVGVEMEISIIHEDLKELNKKLFFLNAIQNQLIENLKILRDPDIIATIEGYNLSITQLKEAQIKIIQTRYEINKLECNLELKVEKRNNLNITLDHLHDDGKILIFKKRA